MANISTGYGTVTIYAKEVRDIAELVYLQHLNEKEVYYYTTLNEIDALSTILNDDNKTLNDKLTAIDKELHTNTVEIYKDCPIYAEFTLDLAGRWAFINNINWFFSQAFNLTHLYNHNDEINQLIDKVKQRNYYVQFRFTEEESGCDFIQEGDVIIKWAGQRQEQTIESEEYQEYEYSASNLIEFGFYDTGDVWDTEYIIENPETFKNELETGILNKQYQDLVEIAENLDLFITFLKDNREGLDTGVYWEIQEWYEGSLAVDGLDEEWSKFLAIKNEK